MTWTCLYLVDYCIGAKAWSDGIFREVLEETGPAVEPAISKYAQNPSGMIALGLFLSFTSPA